MFEVIHKSLLSPNSLYKTLNFEQCHDYDASKMQQVGRFGSSQAAFSKLIITGFVSFDSITYSILKCLNNISVYAYV